MRFHPVLRELEEVHREPPNFCSAIVGCSILLSVPLRDQATPSKDPDADAVVTILLRGQLLEVVVQMEKPLLPLISRYFIYTEVRRSPV